MRSLLFLPVNFLAVVTLIAPMVIGLTAANRAKAADEVGIKVPSAWARAAAGKAKTGAAYLTIANVGQSSDRLTAAATDRAGHAMVHESYTEGGIAKMRHLMGVDVPAGKTVRFSPGGFHIMLMGLKAPLKKGETFPLDLTFDQAGTITVTVTVMGVGARGPASPGGDIGHDHHKK